MAEGADKEIENSPANQQEIGKNGCYSSVKNEQGGGGDPNNTNTTPLIISKLPPVDFTKEKSVTPPPRLNSSNNNNSQDLLDQNPVVVVGLSNGSCNSGTESSDASAGNCSKCENGLDCQGEGGDSSRRHLKSSSLPHGVKLCPESVNASAASDKAQSDEDDKMTNGQDKWACLEEELRKAQRELKDKDAEVETSGSENFERMLRENFERIFEKLKDIRQQVEGELEDLTASLFEEAHKMVKEAKMKEVSSEKHLKEAKMQLDGLQAEVAALKTLLITSTPSRPNLEGTSGGNGISIFKKQHKRYPSHNHLQYGRSDDEDTNGKEKAKHKCNEVIIDPERCEVDPTLHAMFVLWREEPTLSVNNNNNNNQFLQKIYTEDIEPCLSFPNEVLVKKLQKAIEENSIWVEPVPEKDKLSVHTECALVRCPRICNYRMRFAFDSDEWFSISRLCRDRIAAVCEFLNYLRYMKNGLVKASTDDAYWEIIRLRKQIALAKLGIPIS